MNTPILGKHAIAQLIVGYCVSDFLYLIRLHNGWSYSHKKIIFTKGQYDLIVRDYKITTTKYVETKEFTNNKQLFE